MTAPLPRRVVLAAGGTGGHLYPAQALARELIGRGVGVGLFTDRRGGGFGPELPQVETCLISAGGLAGKGALDRLRGAAQLGLGLIQAHRRLKTLGADVVVGFGGYASVPPVLAGARLGLSVVLHEQNAVLGRANRMLSRRARAIATSFGRVDGIAASERAKVRVTGNPVRPAIAALGRRPYALPDQGDRLNLLVVGGSLGAAIFNQVVPGGLCRLPAALRARVRLAQQVPGDGLQAIAAEYRAGGVEAELRPFFDDMAERLAAAHLVICRAGASTVAELAAAGRPGLMVPLPSAIDDHQTANARRLAEAGGGWVMPQSSLSPETLAERLESLLGNPALLARASRCARGCAYDNAAARLADIVCGTSNDDGKDARSQGEAAA